MKHTTIIVAVGLALAAALTAAPAQAQNARSFVSGGGVDGNPCTRVAPCRTFAFAITQTNASGEILTLDPAGYGGLTIDKSISIVSSLGVGGVNMLTAGNAITINAGATDIVSLRGLTIDGLGIGSNGIVFNTGASLTVENSVIRGFTGVGIWFFPTAACKFSVSNSLVADNGASGIAVNASGSGAITGVLNRDEMNNNGRNGIVLNGSASTGIVYVTVSDSVATNNGFATPGFAGFYAFSALNQAPTTLVLVRSVTATNQYGLLARGQGATVRLANSAVTGNTSGWQIDNGGVAQSYGNNSIDGNGTNTGSLTPIAPQ
jgi:hypothetical protein